MTGGGGDGLVVVVAAVAVAAAAVVVMGRGEDGTVFADVVEVEVETADSHVGQGAAANAAPTEL